VSHLQPILKKYPRTRHLETSRFQHGDHDLEAVAFKDVRGQFLVVVVEEKMDGANAGVSFDADGKLLLQSRGHYLNGGPRERHFDMLKQWANAHAEDLYLALGERFIMYGEWMYAKHTCFYDALPAYFMEFDIYDREHDLFLSTARRRKLLADIPVVSVAVLWEGRPHRLTEVTGLVGPSLFKTAHWRDSLVEAGAAAGVPAAQVLAETDRHDTMEGLYIKIEDDERVVDRLKWVRPSFLSAIAEAGGHWLDRPIVVNRLAPAVTGA
jgi:hypothetical protein